MRVIYIHTYIHTYIERERERERERRDERCGLHAGSEIALDVGRCFVFDLEELVIADAGGGSPGAGTVR